MLGEKEIHLEGRGCTKYCGPKVLPSFQYETPPISPPQDAPLNGLSNLWTNNISQIIISHNINSQSDEKQRSIPKIAWPQKMHPKMPPKWVPGGKISCTNTTTPECLVQFGAGIRLGIIYKYTYLDTNRNLREDYTIYYRNLKTYL